MKKFLFVVGLALIHSAPTFACKLSSNSSFFLSDERLVYNTPLILWVKVVKIEPIDRISEGYQNYSRYSFEVLAVVKGAFKEKYLVRQDLVAPPDKLNSNSNRHTGDFKGRSYYAPDCKIYEYGEIGKSYLFFVDAFHPKFFEQVDSRDDSWFEKVRKILKKNGKNR